LHFVALVAVIIFLTATRCNEKSALVALLVAPRSVLDLLFLYCVCWGNYLKKLGFLYINIYCNKATKKIKISKIRRNI